MVDKSRRGRGVLPCSRAPASPRSSPSASPLPPLGGSFLSPPSPPPGHFATQFLKVPSRRREPISAAIPAVTSDCRDTQLSRTHRLHAHQRTAARHRETQITLKRHICLYGGGGVGGGVSCMRINIWRLRSPDFCDLAVGKMQRITKKDVCALTAILRACVRARADFEMKISCFCVFQIYQRDGRKDTHLRGHAASSSELKCVPACVGRGGGGATPLSFPHTESHKHVCVLRASLSGCCESQSALLC